MKRILSLMLLLCVVFSGCGIENEPVDSAGWSSSSSEMAETDCTEAASTSALPKETTREEQKQAFLQSLYEKTGDCNGAYLLPIVLEEEESVICMECDQEKLMILSADTGLNVRLFNLDTGKIDAYRTIETESDGLCDGGYLSDGSIWVYSSEQGKLYYLDQNLEEREEKTVPEYFEWYSDHQEDTLWFQNYDSQILASYQIASGEVREYDLGAILEKSLGIVDAGWNIEAAAYGSIYFSLVGEDGIQKSYRFIPLTERVEINELLSSPYMFFDKDSSAYQFQNQYRIVDCSVPDQLISVKMLGKNESIIGYQNGYLIGNSGDQLLVYDCSNGTCYKAYEMGEEKEEELSNYSVVTAVRSEAQQIILSLEAQEEKMLILCDLDDAETVGHTECSSNTISQVRQQIEYGKYKLEQKYNIDMLTVEDVESNPDWSGYYLEENSWLLNSLDAYEALSGFLDELPNGMVSEILFGNSGKIEIYFSGYITGEENSGNLSSAGGYVTELYDMATDSFYSRMVVDISDPEALQRYLAHEFFHLMENRFVACEEEISMIREGFYERKGVPTPGELAREKIIYDWVSQWIDMSPEDAYIYDYDETLCYNSNFQIDYICLDEEDWDQVYFVDSYSRTFPKEDRARIFEYLYMDSTEEQSAEWLKSEHLRDKAVYLCQLIRCCYSSADNSARNVWEKILNDEDWNRIRENQEKRLESSVK